MARARLRDRPGRRSGRSAAPARRQHAPSSAIIGILLASALAAWGLFAHPSAPGGPAFAAAVIAAMCAWTVGSFLCHVHPAIPGLAVAALVAAAFVFTIPQSLGGSPAAPPLGYANANAALITAAVAGLLGAATFTSRGKARPYVVGAAAAFAMVSAATGSRAGVLSCLAVFLAWPFLASGQRWMWRVAAASSMVALFAGTVVLAVTYEPSQGSGLAERALSDTRLALWSDAVDITRAHPIAGIGPGNFAHESLTARSDPDLAWAHSTPLQVLAEHGIVGVLLLAVLVGWLVYRLGRASVILAIMALQPLVDHVMHQPSVIVAMSVVLAGWAWPNATTPRPMSRDPAPSDASNEQAGPRSYFGHRDQSA